MDYRIADRETKRINTYLVETERKLKSTLAFDEVNAMKQITLVWQKVLKEFRVSFLKIAKGVYAKEGADPDYITYRWLTKYLENYDAVTKYRFTSEWDRKKARLFEAVMADPEDREDEIEKAIYYLSVMFRQYSINITDEATLEAYRWTGIFKVQWIAQIDGKTCETCRERHRMIYSIDDVPDKPHYNCRCTLKPIVK